MQFLKKIFGRRKEEAPTLINSFQRPTATGREAGAIWQEGAALVIENDQVGARMRFDRVGGNTLFHLETPTQIIAQRTTMTMWPNGQERPVVETTKISRLDI